jgi:hypothetical protein
MKTQSFFTLYFCAYFVRPKDAAAKRAIQPKLVLSNPTHQQKHCPLNLMAAKILFVA